jgi:heat shock protein HtpX
MARTRFVGDLGLTTRMTAVIFLLGGLFVALVVGLMYAFPAYAWLIGLAGLGVAWWQWYSSDTIAMKAMRAREVNLQQAPELYGMIQRLCTLADMPMPRVGVADTDLPNAFATGRSPKRAVVVVTTGILRRLDAEELEGVLAHELSHVAHRDVLVMTVASTAGIIAGMLGRGAQYGAMFGGFGGRRDDRNTGGLPIWLIVLVGSLIVYAVSFLLLRLLSRYRELAADRAGAQLTMRPRALASAL